MKKREGRPVVLVVDDEHEARSLMLDFLKVRYECDFKEASDGEEAMRFVENNPCDIMLLDIKMPRKGGMQVLKEVKASKPDIDILIVSAWASDDVAEEAMTMGAVDYILKPIDLKVLSMKFTNVLDRWREKAQ